MRLNSLAVSAHKAAPSSAWFANLVAFAAECDTALQVACAAST